MRVVVLTDPRHEADVDACYRFLQARIGEPIELSAVERWLPCPDERVGLALASAVHGPGLYGCLVDRALRQSAREGTLWTPMLDRLSSFGQYIPEPWESRLAERIEMLSGEIAQVRSAEKLEPIVRAFRAPLVVGAVLAHAQCLLGEWIHLLSASGAWMLRHALSNTRLTPDAARAFRRAAMRVIERDDPWPLGWALDLISHTLHFAAPDIEETDGLIGLISTMPAGSSANEYGARVDELIASLTDLLAAQARAGALTPERLVQLCSSDHGAVRGAALTIAAHFQH